MQVAIGTRRSDGSGNRRGSPGRAHPTPTPEELLNAIPEIASGRWRVVTCTVTHIRKHLSKRLIAYELECEDGVPGRRDTHRVVAKICRDDRGRGGLACLRALRDAGFRPPGELRVPRPYGYSPEHRALLQEHVEGTPWSGHLENVSAALDASRRAATWLAALQSSPVVSALGVPEAQPASVERHVANLGRAYPRRSAAIRRVADELLRELRDPRPPGPSHGDFHPENVLLADGATTVIDPDKFAMRDPAFDVGYAIGQLLIMSTFRFADQTPGRRAAAAFWNAYRHAGGHADNRRVAVHIARTFLQSVHYELCVLRNGRTELLSSWPKQSERWLSHGAWLLEDIVRRR